MKKIKVENAVGTVLAGEALAMGHGGLCLNCEQCRFPVCPLGK